MKEARPTIVPLVILLGSGAAVGTFVHSQHDWTFWELGKFLFSFVVSLIVGLFVNAQIFLPILYNLPRSIYLYFTRKLRFVGIWRQFIAPVLWITGFFILGFVAPSTAERLSGSMGVSFGWSLSTVAVLLSLVTPSGLLSLKADYNENTLARFGRVPGTEQKSSNP